MSFVKELQICGYCDKPLLRGSACARCKLTHYCNRSCQAQHWPTHKLLCNTNRQKREYEQSQKEANEIIQNIQRILAGTTPDDSALFEKLQAPLNEFYGTSYGSAALAHACVMRRMADMLSVIVVCIEYDAATSTFGSPRSCYHILDRDFQDMIANNALQLGEDTFDLGLSAPSLQQQITTVYKLEPHSIPLILIAVAAAAATAAVATATTVTANSTFIRPFPEAKVCGIVHSFTIPAKAS